MNTEAMGPSSGDRFARLAGGPGLLFFLLQGVHL